MNNVHVLFVVVLCVCVCVVLCCCSCLSIVLFDVYKCVFVVCVILLAVYTSCTYELLMYCLM